MTVYVFYKALIKNDTGIKAQWSSDMASTDQLKGPEFKSNKNFLNTHLSRTLIWQFSQNSLTSNLTVWC